MNVNIIIKKYDSSKNNTIPFIQELSKSTPHHVDSHLRVNQCFVDNFNLFRRNLISDIIDLKLKQESYSLPLRNVVFNMTHTSANILCRLKNDFYSLWRSESWADVYY